MGWSWPRGYFYQCPLPFSRAECSHRDYPGPLRPQPLPGGLRTWHWSRGKDLLPPELGSQPLGVGPEKAPSAPREPPAPCPSRAASLDGELGYSPLQDGHRHWGGSRGDKAAALGPKSRDERGAVPELFCPHPSSFLRSCCSGASAGNGPWGCVRPLPGDGSGAGRGWGRDPCADENGAGMEAGQDERGQALFQLCRHWKKFPVKARKGQTSSFILIKLERSTWALCADVAALEQIRWKTGNRIRPNDGETRGSSGICPWIPSRTLILTPGNMNHCSLGSVSFSKLESQQLFW